MIKSQRIHLGLPVYNGAKYLAETIRSILSQTYTDFRIFVSDNASSDETAEICQEYIKLDSRIVYFRQTQNMGAAWNYNRTFLCSSAPYFKWTAADDVLAPTYLERCAACLDHSPNAVLAYPRTVIIDANGDKTASYDDRLHKMGDTPLERFVATLSLIGECNAVFGLIRRSTLGSTALIGSYPASDTHLLLELALYGDFIQIPEDLFFRREHSQSSSADKSINSQMAFFDPKRHAGRTLPLWSGLCADLRAIGRATISPAQRLKLYYRITRLAIASRAKYLRELRCILSQR